MSKEKSDLFKDRVQRHRDLHRALDELVACYLETTRKDLKRKPLGSLSMHEFSEWSQGMTIDPACGHDTTRTAKPHGSVIE